MYDHHRPVRHYVIARLTADGQTPDEITVLDKLCPGIV